MLLRRCPALVPNLQRLAGCGASRDEDALVEFEVRPGSLVVTDPLGGVGTRAGLHAVPAEGGACTIPEALHAAALAARAALKYGPSTGNGGAALGGAGQAGGGSTGAASSSAGSGSDWPTHATTKGPAVAAAPAGLAAAAYKSCSVCGALEGPGGTKLRTCSGCRKPNLFYCGAQW